MALGRTVEALKEKYQKAMAYQLGVSKVSAYPKATVICKLLLQAIVYKLWRERNTRLHTSVSKSADCLIKEDQVLMRQKLAGLDKKATSPSSSTPTMNVTDLTLTL
ncbi:unnamed protein product [Arabis nemorensis]|uniref:Uncharacterized protein n=1 Tax=Arabis nemorensis TaxID=586526 RepID=A0A565CA03_9BRAS|nr:unnamed protein product [Arabis nemorensis]